MFIYNHFLFQTPLQGKNHAQYVKQGAFCLETQKYPDAVNHVSFQYHCLLSTRGRRVHYHKQNISKQLQTYTYMFVCICLEKA